MRDMENELAEILDKFAESGWDVIDAPAKAWLLAWDEEWPDEEITEKLISAVKQADKECGSCGCEFDPLYKRALELIAAGKIN